MHLPFGANGDGAPAVIPAQAGIQWCRKPLNSRAVSSILSAPKRPWYGVIDPGLPHGT
jgi:hypothetical protein